jgi:hypothetical protein
MRKSKSNVFKKSKKCMKNKNKSRQTKKKFRAVNMYGGTYDTNQVFNFLDSAIFRGTSSIIKFKTFSGETYNISKNPNKLLEIGASPDILRKLIESVRMKTNIANMTTNRLSGMFFLYGTDELIGRHVGVKHHYYGLFYLLDRIELLAVLLNLKNFPRFSTIDVHFPINESSRLPEDYNKFPHGYFYRWDHNDNNLSLFIDFLENIRQVETKLLIPVEPVETTLLELLPSNIIGEDDVLKKQQQQLIEELKIPPFLTMLKMRNSVITPKEPEEEEDPEEVEYLTRLREERRESKKKQDELWAKMPDTKLEPLPNDRDVISAIIFINNLIQRAELKIPPLPVDVNSVNIDSLKKIRKPLFQHVDPQNAETKTESQDLIKYWNILKRRYQPQSAGKKKRRIYKPFNK